MSLNELAVAARELRDALRQRWSIPRGYPNSEPRQLAEHTLSAAIERTRSALAAIPAEPDPVPTAQVRRAIAELRILADPATMADGADFVGMEAIAGTAVNVLIKAGANVAMRSTTAAGNSGTSGEPKPKYDAESRELLFGGSLEKRFRQNAGNQEAVLKVFEESGWRKCIKPPLPKSQIGDTVRRLNDGLSRIRFDRDGTGKGVRWHPAIPPKRP